MNDNKYFNNQIPDDNIKPPLGLLPKDLYYEKAKIERINHIGTAINRYVAAGVKIKPEWVEEWNELVDEFFKTNTDER